MDDLKALLSTLLIVIMIGLAAWSGYQMGYYAAIHHPQQQRNQ